MIIINIKIEKLQNSDAEKLFEFELENRLYFEEMVPDRGDEYYDFDNFRTQLRNLLDEQMQGKSYFYLIKTMDDSIAGRINIADIKWTQNSGELGYRVGKSYTGRGVANKALKQLIKITGDLKIDELSAKTTDNNIVSQKVMEKNGFKQSRINHETFNMNGHDVKFVHYIWTKEY